MRKNYIIALLLLGTGLYGQKMSKTNLGQEISTISKKVEKKYNKETDEIVLWEQKKSEAEHKYGLVSTYYMPDNWGLYSADDFKAENDITINSLLFYGSQSNEEAASLIKKVNLYLYKDNDGKPNGSPENQGSEFLKLAFDYNNLTVEPGEFAYMGDKIYHIDVRKVLGDGIKLPVGVYWISIVFDIDSSSSDFDNRFVWVDSEELILSQPKVISKELGINDWTNVPEVGFPIKAFAFTFYGDNTILSTSSIDLEKIDLFPNPSADYFYLAGKTIKEIKSIEGINMLGQKMKLNYNNGKVDISHLKKGEYIILINTSNGTISKKIIKK